MVTTTIRTRALAVAAILALAACTEKPPAPPPPSREAALGALTVAISAEARRRAASRPIPTNTNAAAQLGRDAAVMRLANRCSSAVIGITAVLATADLAAEFERLQQENPPLLNVAEIELLPESRRLAPTGRALPQICGDALTRMQQIMTRRPYLVQVRQGQPPQPTPPRPAT